jgi:hypothetical protein
MVGILPFGDAGGGDALDKVAALEGIDGIDLVVCCPCIFLI